MKNRSQTFNIILMSAFLAFAGGLLAAGDKPSANSKPEAAKKEETPKKPKDYRRGGKEATTISLHWEMNPDGTDRCVTAMVHRASQLVLQVDRSPVLHEGYLEKAEVVEVLGSYEIRLKFDRSGTLLLENVSMSHRGRRLAMFSQFSDARWIGAPLINRRITDGVLSFTPDASRAEAERIVRGLNNVASVWQKKK